VFFIIPVGVEEALIRVRAMMLDVGVKQNFEQGEA
jgi:hypothetical protein